MPRAMYHCIKSTAVYSVRRSRNVAISSENLASSCVTMFKNLLMKLDLLKDSATSNYLFELVFEVDIIVTSRKEKVGEARFL